MLVLRQCEAKGESLDALEVSEGLLDRDLRGGAGCKA